MAARGRETLRWGPMKPVGLTDPHRPGVKPHAVVQLRQDNRLGTLFNIVGFQTKLKHAEQVRVFRMIPGLEQPNSRGSADCTAIPSSMRQIARSGLRLKAMPRLRFAGQITGCEGYVESAAIGLLAGRFAAAERRGETPELRRRPPPRRAPRPHHRRPCGNHRRRPALVPADERQFRTVSAACHARRAAAPTASGCAAPPRRWPSGCALTSRALADLDAWAHGALPAAPAAALEPAVDATPVPEPHSG